MIVTPPNSYGRPVAGMPLGSDRKRLRRLDAVLGDPDATEWRRLGDRADDGHATWRLLRG